MSANQKMIYVYDDFSQEEPILLGMLYVNVIKGGETYSFEYSNGWLKQTNLSVSLDPELMPYGGRQFPNGKNIFGVFADASPDRWGRVLMNKRERILAQKEDRKPRKLYIAKFPSKNDENDTGAWEMVTHDLAKLCGLNVPDAKLEKFSKLGSTYLVKRFDRNGKKRIHFASAMTLLGKTDGASAADGTSYLDMADFIKSNGASPKADLVELWKRIVFNMAVSNTDDHLRNHAFILMEKGWILSPLYDVNPVPYGDELSLNVDEYDNSIRIDLAVETAVRFGLTKADAEKSAENMLKTVRENWRPLAVKYGLTRGQMEEMRPAFSACFE